MAKKLSKSSKQFLSVLFHLAVLGFMVLLYDTGKFIAQQLGWFGAKAESVGDSTALNFMDAEEVLDISIDPKLEKLVTQNKEGFVFRRDVPAPPHLKVVTTEVVKFEKVRAAGKSEFHDGSTTLSLRKDEVMEYEMAGNAVRVTMKEKATEKELSATEKIAMMKAEGGKAGGKKTEEGQAPTGVRIEDKLKGNVVQFNYDGKAWKALATKRFATMAWGKNLEEKIDGILVENGLKPRPRWFGTKPMKVGDPTRLANESLDLVFDDTRKGSLSMVFKGMEGVHGHPCGVFDVEGAVMLDETENAEGQKVNVEMTIEKGRVWFSLLHPVVLRTELDTIQSIVTKEGKTLVSQLQGEVRETMHREWKAVVPEPKKASAKKPAGK